MERESNIVDIKEELLRQKEEEILEVEKANREATFVRQDFEAAMKTGRRFAWLREEIKKLGGSWEEIKKRNEEKMWKKIEEKRRKEREMPEDYREAA